MGYFDVQTNSWICQDKCLKPSSNNFVCGSTNHFTNFGVLLEGVSSGCDPQYIFGKAIYDSSFFLFLFGVNAHVQEKSRGNYSVKQKTI